MLWNALGLLNVWYRAVFISQVVTALPRSDVRFGTKVGQIGHKLMGLFRSDFMTFWFSKIWKSHRFGPFWVQSDLFLGQIWQPCCRRHYFLYVGPIGFLLVHPPPSNYIKGTFHVQIVIWYTCRPTTRNNKEINNIRMIVELIIFHTIKAS